VIASRQVPLRMPRCHVRIDNRARVHDLQLRLKDFNALEKERPLLFKEDRKSLVRSYHSLVSFNLREVRVHGQVQGHGRR